MSAFHNKIGILLKEYEKNRGFWTRLLGFFGIPRFRRNPGIEALRTFNYSWSKRTLVSEVEVLQCIIQNKSSLLQADDVCKVYDGIMKAVFPSIVQLANNRTRMIDSLDALNQSNCLNEKTLNLFRIWMGRIPNYIKQINETLAYLHGAKLLNLKNFEAVRAEPDFGRIALAVKSLAGAGLLKQTNFDTINAAVDSTSLTCVMKHLAETGLLNQTTFNTIKEHLSPVNLASAVKNLADAGLLNQTNTDALKAHGDPQGLASMLSVLASARILTQNNFDAVKTHAAFRFITAVQSMLGAAEFSSQHNFEHLLKLANIAPLVEDTRVLGALKRIISSPLFNQAVFEQLIECAARPNPAQQIMDYTNANQLFSQGSDAGFFQPIISAEDSLVRTQPAHLSSLKP